ncbi:MAG: MBL fold metallo-hydrolase [Thermoanaerobaculia bacterium]
MEWIPLGTNGFFPSFGRQTMSFLVLAGDQALLLDAGTGVGRLAEPALAARLGGCPRLDVLLTHYHLDHVVGLSYLRTLWAGPLRIHAPEAPLVDAPARESLARLIGPPFFPRPLAAHVPPIEVAPYTSERMAIGPFELELRRQRHDGGSVGVRLGSELAYVTDTELDEGTIALAAGVHTLLHEVWWSDEEAAAAGFTSNGHSWVGGVADLADRAGVRRLVPVHHHPRRSSAAVAELAAGLDRRTACEVLLAQEGEAYRSVSQQQPSSR